MSGVVKSAVSFPPYAGYDRALVPAYGLPRVLNSDEMDEVLKERAQDRCIRVTARQGGDVVKHLDLVDRELAQLEGKRVLVGGEGASTFGQLLEKRGAQVTALDRIYATPRSLMAQRYLVAEQTRDSYVARLVAPDEVFARLPAQVVGGDLTRLPFASGTFDRVFVPHVLYWYLDPSYSKTLGDAARLRELGLAILDEAYRVTRDGGFLHFNLASSSNRAAVLPVVKKRFPKALVAELANCNVRLTRP